MAFVGTHRTNNTSARDTKRHKTQPAKRFCGYTAANTNPEAERISATNGLTNSSTKPPRLMPKMKETNGISVAISDGKKKGFFLSLSLFIL